MPTYTRGDLVRSKEAPSLWGSVVSLSDDETTLYLYRYGIPSLFYASAAVDAVEPYPEKEASLPRGNWNIP